MQETESPHSRDKLSDGSFTSASPGCVVADLPSRGFDLACGARLVHDGLRLGTATMSGMIDARLGVVSFTGVGRGWSGARCGGPPHGGGEVHDPPCHGRRPDNQARATTHQIGFLLSLWQPTPLNGARAARALNQPTQCGEVCRVDDQLLRTREHGAPRGGE